MVVHRIRCIRKTNLARKISATGSSQGREAALSAGASAQIRETEEGDRLPTWHTLCR